MINETEYLQLKARVIQILKKNHEQPAQKIFYALRQSFHDVPISTLSGILDELIAEEESKNDRPT